MSAVPPPTNQQERSISEQAHRWVTRLAGGAAGSDDLNALRLWLDIDPLHQAAFEEARTTWQLTESLADDFAVPVTTANVVAFGRASRRRGLVAGLAALAACFLFAAIFDDDLRVVSEADFRTGVGEVREVVLADGSRVTLNTDSAIAVDFRSGERLIGLLRGEAYFDVKPDPMRPFRVAALGGATSAVGTAFAVREDGMDVSVAVSEGTVRVASPAVATNSSNGILLKAGQFGGYRESAAPALNGTVDQSRVAAWRNGRIVFDGRSFEDAIKELDRYLPGRILLAGDARRDRPVSAVFSVDAVDGALDALAETQGLNVLRITDYLIILR
ncbi:FecR domain-containing protein [Nisaea acidiphila]|uniref:FecR domain-containing protein n=1 Tax=Nisaea acidiphila TaxID=1862145 RepID=A0A9J7ARB5_9PROT|nr:FecR domain-containing protein [Nisaea acidiphila]UUX48884.1 FecR domain-containing protein [Nisaea acidiphila]